MALTQDEKYILTYAINYALTNPNIHPITKTKLEKLKIKLKE